MSRLKLEDGQRFDYRVGSQGFSLGGILQDPDAGSNPPNRPRMVLNGRFQGGGVISRPPYTYVDYIPDFLRTQATAPYTETLHQWDGKFMSEHHPTRQNNQLWVGRYDGSSSYLSILDQPFKQPVDIASYPTVVAAPPVVERFNGQIFVGDTGYLRRIYRIGQALADLPTDDILYTFAGFRAYAMHEFNGRLYVFVADPLGVASAFVFSYDGLTVFAEVTLGTPGASGASFAEFKGKLFLGIAGDTTLHFRDDAGVWSGVTDGAFLHSGFANAMVPGGDSMTIYGDSNVSTYTEPAGVPTLTVGAPGLPSGWSSATVGARIGAYTFTGGSKVWPSDTFETPVFRDDVGFDGTVQINTESALGPIIAKGMAVFGNRVYFCYGFRSPAVGGSAIGFYQTPRTVISPVGIEAVMSGVGTGSSIELMKGDH
ncbi:MAG: hypothetical protein GY906_24815 [bacterium]|nr:hypothetical protein [bacterium]